MSPTLLIDGDILAYKAGTVAEQAIDWGNGLWTLHAHESTAQQVLERQLDDIEDNLHGGRLVIALSSDTNFRKDMYPDYKANRKSVRKPLLLSWARQWLKSNYDTYERPDLEADDILGILGTSPIIIPGEKIIVSLDKDLKTVPGLFCDTRTWKVTRISERQAQYTHMFQTLTGDRVDNIPGCPGMGPKRVEKILQEGEGYEVNWPLVVQAYEKAGQTVEQALLMARLTRILQRDDYAFEGRYVKLWQPPFMS